ncbi:hypothetical protein NESM_000885000 [Novymonas esmeraldas]|uniref:Uncharacterized protein n=1 Tax=Novymonas esmeraldas TaxID=1808958 RepID=A0AAW0F1M4_9TRYP
MVVRPLPSTAATRGVVDGVAGDADESDRSAGAGQWGGSAALRSASWRRRCSASSRCSLPSLVVLVEEDSTVAVLAEKTSMVPVAVLSSPARPCWRGGWRVELVWESDESCKSRDAAMASLVRRSAVVNSARFRRARRCVAAPLEPLRLSASCGSASSPKHSSASRRRPSALPPSS